MSEEEKEPVENEDSEVMAYAAKLGWHNPEDDDFRGDPETALNAKDFVARMDEHPAMKRENFDRLVNKTSDLEKTIVQMKTDQDSYIEMNNKAYRKSLEKDQREASDAGETDRVMELTEEITKIKTPEPQSNQQDPEIAREGQAFMQRNSWYHSNPDMRNYANALDATSQGTTPAEHYANIERKAMEAFKVVAPKVEKGGRGKQKTTKKNTFENMPKDAQDMCERMSKGRNNPEKFKETFVKTHYEGAE